MKCANMTYEITGTIKAIMDDYEIECPYCHMKITKSEVSDWVGCDACNDGECWLAAQLEKPNTESEVS